MTTFNTMNPVPSADARDRYDNSQVFDELMNGVAPNTPDRLGVLRQSWSGMEQAFNQFLINSGFEPTHLIYVDGSPLQVDRPTQLIDRAGAVYRVKMPASFPVTLSGTWATDAALLVDVGDQSLRTEVAAPDGAGLVGFTPSAAFPPGTVGKRLSMEVTPYDFGAVGDGINDDTVPLQNWLNSSISKRKYLPAGTYKISAEITGKPGDYIYGDGSSSIIDGSAGIGGALRCFSVTGQLVALPNLASNVALRANALPLVSAPSVAFGDVILIWNPTDSSWSTWRPDYRAGEWCRVGTVSGSTITIYGRTYDAYTAAAVQLHKLVGPSTTLRDFVIKQPFTANAGLVVDLIDTPHIHNVEASGGVYAGIDVRRCMDIDVDCQPRQASTPSGNNYGLAIGNSQGGSVRGVYYGTRHSISLGGSPGLGSVSCRDMDIYATYRALDGGINSVDLHGNTENIRFHGVNAQNGFVVAGKNNSWYGGSGEGGTNSGIAMYMGEVVSGTFNFVGVSLASLVDPNPSGNGLMSFQNFTANVTGDCDFVFTGLIVKCPAATTFPILFALNGTSVRVNLHFTTPITFTGAAGLTQVLRLRQFGATGQFGVVSMPDAPSGIPTTGCAYAVEVGSPTVGAYNLPVQRGALNVAVTTAASLFTQALTFPHAYPRTPTVTVSTANPTVGGKRIATGHQTDSTTGSVAIVATTDVTNFTSAASAGIEWTAGINTL